jgi:hypothetical protein
MSTPADTPAPTTPAAAADRPKPERTYLPFNGQMVLHESLLFFRNGQALKEFLDGFRSLREQFQRVRGLAVRREQALTTGEKDALAKVIEQEAKDFDSKDNLFQKVYGFRSGAIFSQNRPCYIYRTCNLLTQVDNEEIAKIKAEKDFKPESLVERDGKMLHQLATLGGLVFDEFERNLSNITARRDNLAKARENLANIPAEERPKAEANLAEFEANLAKDNELMFKTYRFTLGRNMVLDFIDAKFFVALTKEDVQKAQAAGGAPAAAKAPEAKKDKPAKAN